GAEDTQARSHDVKRSHIESGPLDADDGANVVQMAGGAALGKGVELAGNGAFGRDVSGLPHLVERQNDSLRQRLAQQPPDPSLLATGNIEVGLDMGGKMDHVKVSSLHH